MSKQSAIGRLNAAKTHCPQGHAYDEANTYVYKRRRYCRACVLVRSKACHAAKRKRKREWLEKMTVSSQKVLDQLAAMADK